MSAPAIPRDRIEHFAEMLSLDNSPAECGRRLGLTKGETAYCWRRIRRELGEQAR